MIPYDVNAGPAIQVLLQQMQADLNQVDATLRQLQRQQPALPRDGWQGSVRPGSGMNLPPWLQPGPTAPRPTAPAPANNGKAVSLAGPGRGFPEPGPWLSFYGGAAQMGNLDQVAAKYRVLNIDADPGTGNFTRAQIQQLKAGGQNRVMSYLNVGAVESFRDYWKQVPKDGVLGQYEGYADERWMDPANPAWRKLLLDTVIPRLVAQGVDGFFLDNLEVVEHKGTSARSRQAGLELIREIRDRYPNMLIVLQNGTSDVTRRGQLADGRSFASLLDGVSHESVFTQPNDADDARNTVYRFETDDDALAQMRAWRNMNLRPGGRPLLLSVSEYVNSTENVNGARRAQRLGQAEGFTTFVTDKSGGQQRVPWKY